MTGRADPYGRAVRKYLAGVTGIPDLRWVYAERAITAPYPYSIPVRTDRVWYRVVEPARNPDTFVVMRYGEQSPKDGLVIMTVESFAPLLKAIYEAEVLPRILRGENRK